MASREREAGISGVAGPHSAKGVAADREIARDGARSGVLGRVHSPCRAYASGLKNARSVSAKRSFRHVTSHPSPTQSGRDSVSRLAIPVRWFPSPPAMRKRNSPSSAASRWTRPVRSTLQTPSLGQSKSSPPTRTAPLDRCVRSNGHFSGIGHGRCSPSKPFHLRSHQNDGALGFAAH